MTSTALLAAAQAVDDALRKLVAAVNATPGRLGHYDADAWGLAMLISLSRNGEAVLDLARASVRHAPAAAVVARTAFELAMKVGWLLEPADPFARDARYLGWLESGEVHERRIARELEELGDSGAVHNKTADALRAFRTAVAAKLPSHLTTAKMPNMRELLKGLREQRRYLSYMHYSQYVHGTFGALTGYIQGLGSGKSLEERIDVGHWRGPFELVWFAIWYAGSWVLHRARANEDPDFVSDPERADVARAIERLSER